MTDPDPTTPSPATPPPAASIPPAAPPAAAPPAAAPTSPPVAPADYAPRPAGSSTLGVIAFVASLAGVVIGSILAFIGSQSVGRLVQYADARGQIDANSLPADAQAAAATGGILIAVAFLVYGVLALWGFIQGIFATVKKLGRGWGITAIVLAVVGGGIVGIFLAIGAAAGAAQYINTIG